MKKLISVLIIISTFASMSTNIYANTSVNIEKGTAIFYRGKLILNVA